MKDNIISRVPPSDSQAEQAVLGSMLVDKDANVSHMIKYVDGQYIHSHFPVPEAETITYLQESGIHIKTDWLLTPYEKKVGPSESDIP